MIDHATRHRLCLVLLLFITATAGTWYKKKPQSTYREGLATHRRQFKVAQQAVKKPSQKWGKEKPVHITPMHAVTDQLAYLLEQKKAASEQVKHVQGYTIQVYTGGSREAAFKARNKLYTHYPASKPEVAYDLPNYTVRIGKFLDKLEAYPVYAAIKKHIPQAIIRPISFANTPHVFINKQADEPKDAASSVPTTKAPNPNDQELG